MENIRSVVPVAATPTDQPRVIRFLASTTKVARDRGIIEAKAWNTDRFAKNPIFLFAHQHDQLPIGRVLKTEISADGLLADVEFAGEDQKNERAECVYRMFKSGFMNAVSVGFNVLKQRAPTDAERAEGAEWVATAAELLEISAVPVPADPDALAISRAVKDGTLRKSDIAFVRSNWGAIEGWTEAAKAAEAAMAAPTKIETKRALIDPYMGGDPEDGVVVAIGCASCGCIIAHCPACGKSFDEDEKPEEKPEEKPIPETPAAEAPVEKACSNKSNSTPPVAVCNFCIIEFSFYN